MNLLLARTTALLSLALLFSLAMADSKPEPSLAKVVSYVAEVFRVREMMTQATVQQSAGDPKFQAAMKAAFADIFINDLAARLAVPLSESLTPAEATPCLEFIESDDGAAFLAVAKQAETTKLLGEAVLEMPQPQRRRTREFFDSRCFKTVVSFLGSKESLDISQRYGLEVVCYFIKRTDPKMANVSKKAREDCSKL
ncbi:hypothetical protein [Pseudomonas sp. CGJS7]|uniref:hypothetical protein n=1 Tax=Pseudomonas sp. CGJS7 TaxID=3109348 RepID=UPI0030093E84